MDFFEIFHLTCQLPWCSRWSQSWVSVAKVVHLMHRQTTSWSSMIFINIHGKLCEFFNHVWYSTMCHMLGPYHLPVALCHQVPGVLCTKTQVDLLYDRVSGTWYLVLGTNMYKSCMLQPYTDAYVAAD